MAKHDSFFPGNRRVVRERDPLLAVMLVSSSLIYCSILSSFSLLLQAQSLAEVHTPPTFYGIVYISSVLSSDQLHFSLVAPIKFRMLKHIQFRIYLLVGAIFLFKK